MNSETYKEQEKSHYKVQACALSEAKQLDDVSWEQFYPMYLRKPYNIYIDLLKKSTTQDSAILELCCGVGQFSFQVAKLTKNTIRAVDFSEESICFARNRLALSSVKNIDFVVGDVDCLNMPENSFDIICIAGSLSYLNIDILAENLKKWLKPDGCFVAVDTYGYNPIFNIKRRLNYIFGKTTRQTVLGIPKKDTIDKIKKQFNEFEIHYCGIFSFFGPFLRYIVGSAFSAKIINKLDDMCPFFKKYAFKIVFCAKKPIKG